MSYWRSLPKPSWEIRPAMPKLSNIQRTYLRAIMEFVSIKGYPPTHKECAALVGKAFTYGRSPIYALEKKGYVRLDHYSARGTVVLFDEDGKPVRFEYVRCA